MVETARVKDRAIGALVGLAVGDAIGTTLEFSRRDSYEHLTDMIGGGPFSLEPGEWTDDMSMALCLADSLIAQHGRLDPAHLLSAFCAWYRSGHNSVTGQCFDIGTATRQALIEFEQRGTTANNAEGHMQANGSIMRLAPVVLCAPDREAAVRLALEQGATTHAAEVPQQCCQSLSSLLWDLTQSGDKGLVGPGYLSRSRDSIVSSGHAPATLEAASWAVATTGDFRSAVLRAINLGGDSDTVGAVAGQIAGSLYGYSAIPEGWLDCLAWHDHIVSRAEALWNLRSA